MADSVSIMLKRSAPAVSGFKRSGLTLTVEADLTIAKLRIYGEDRDARFHSVVGFVPPQPCRQLQRKGLSFAWLAPGEWLITGSESEVGDWLCEVNARGDDELLALDFTNARTSFVLSGRDARTALAAHCPLDLWDKSFPVDAVARSLLGDVAMFIARLSDSDDGSRFRIVVDQTMSLYAAGILARS